MSTLRPTAIGYWASGISGLVTDPIAADKAQGFVPTGIARAEYFNWLHGVAGQWHGYLDVARGVLWFGDGSDGNATLAAGTPTTYARDVFYQNLNVASGATLCTGNYRVRVADKLTNLGSIHCDGPLATGTTGARAIPAGSLFGGGDGGNGRTGAGFTGTSEFDSLGGAGGAGGAGAGGGGAAGGVTSLPASFGSIHDPSVASRGYALGVTGAAAFVRGLAGGGGGGGGGGGAAGAAFGGGGGAAGGNVNLFARTIVNNGNIAARGGGGATSIAGSNPGGGGGGGGGAVVAGYLEISGSGTIDVSGGPPGTAGGGAGATGATGTITRITSPL